MLNRTPPQKPDTSDVINSYRKRRMQRGPFLIYGAVGLLILVGIYFIVQGFSGGGGNSPLAGIFATDTSTPSVTPLPTDTLPPSMTPTITETPTATFTPTPSEPFPYTIVEGDVLEGIAERFNLGDDGVLLILDYNPDILENNGVIFLGQTLIIPPPGTTRATATPIPANLPRGTRIDYSVLPGDTLAGIAATFNSREEDIISANNIEDANALSVGQVLKIPVNLVTPTATLPPTSTPVTPTVPGQSAQAASSTPAPGNTSGVCDYSENADFETELATLINNARTETGGTALKPNDNLAKAARAHGIEMVCNDYLGHVGLDGSTPEDRVASEGYKAVIVIEDIYALHPAYGISPQAAFNWWMNNSKHRADLLNGNVTDYGIVYVESEDSLLGAYFVLVLASP